MTAQLEGKLLSMFKTLFLRKNTKTFLELILKKFWIL